MELLASRTHLASLPSDLYYFRANEIEKQWARDNAAALKIQSKFRMYVRRKDFLRKKAAAIKIETHFRAYYARQQFKLRLAQDRNARNLQYFAQQATMIQKLFRGYFIRKYLHNFYMRKSELAALQAKNQQFKAELDEFGAAQAEEAEEYQQELAKAEFGALAKNLHHLSSTKGIPGVYNSPFALQKPAVFDRTVEEHLKSAFRESYKWRAPNREQILKYSIRSSK